jgi:hypothetical protein
VQLFSDTALGLSKWTIKEMVFNGTLRRVRVPRPNGEDMRRLLLDRAQLDEVVDAWAQR